MRYFIAYLILFAGIGVSCGPRPERQVAKQPEGGDEDIRAWSQVAPFSAYGDSVLSANVDGSSSVGGGLGSSSSSQELRVGPSVQGQHVAEVSVRESQSVRALAYPSSADNFGFARLQSEFSVGSIELASLGQRIQQDDVHLEDRFGSVVIENDGKTSLEAPFLYSSLDFNLENIEVLIHQLQGLNLNHEQKMRTLWKVLAGKMVHYCAAGDHNFFPTAPSDLLRFGFLCCDQAAFLMGYIAKQMGYLVRQVAIDGGGGHSLLEIYYDEGWHLFDVDFGVVVTSSSGVAISAARLLMDPDLLSRDLGDYAQLFKTTSLIQYLGLSDADPHMIYAVNRDFGTLDLIWEGKARRISEAEASRSYNPFSLFPGERIIYTNSTPAEGRFVKFSPYTDYGPPSNVGLGRLHRLYDLTSDPRIWVEKDRIYIALFGGFPFIGGALKVTVGGQVGNIGVGLIRGQTRQSFYPLPDVFCDFSECKIEVDLGEILALVRQESGVEDPSSNYRSLPFYYLALTLPSGPEKEAIKELDFYADFQFPLYLLPRKELSETYELRTISPEPRSVKIEFYD